MLGQQARSAQGVCRSGGVANGAISLQTLLTSASYSGVRDITLDLPLMHVVCGGALADLEDHDRVQCQRSAGWFQWDG